MTGAKTRRALVLSTLWPNAVNPRFGTFVARSIEALAAHTDWEPTVINPIGVPPLALGRYRALKQAAVDGQEHGVEVHRPTFRLIPGIGARFNPSAIADAVLPLVRRLHRERPFELVDAQFFWPDGPAATLIASELGLPYTIKARGADIHYWGSKDYSRKAMLAAAHQAHGLLAVCGALASDMEALGMKGDKITLHYTGLDRDRFRPLAHSGLRSRLSESLEIPLSETGELLVTVGALIERKGQAMVIEALTQLPDARLLLVGKGEDEAKLRALATQRGVGKRVHFLGSVDHDVLPPLLSAADAMVLPSASEGLANAWIEALACGTPIVITDAGGAREVLRGPEAGVIVARDAQAIASGVRLVLDNPHDPQAVAATVDAFSWEANGRALAAHYETMIRPT